MPVGGIGACWHDTDPPGANSLYGGFGNWLVTHREEQRQIVTQGVEDGVNYYCDV